MENFDLIRANSLITEHCDKKRTILLKSVLNLNKLIIFNEKQVNCVGCGACQSLCEFSAIEIVDHRWKVNFKKCKNCLKCLNLLEPKTLS